MIQAMNTASSLSCTRTGRSTCAGGNNLLRTSKGCGRCGGKIKMLIFVFLIVVICKGTSPRCVNAQTIYAAGRGGMAVSVESAAEVIALSGKENPRVLYLGTASYDNPRNAQIDTQSYVDLGCTVQYLNVSWIDPDRSEMTRSFERVDIILLSGGNTLFAVDRWAKLGMDTVIRTAALDRGIVIAGGSAGFISLCRGGHSDSMKPESYKNPNGPLLSAQPNVQNAVGSSWQYIRTPGLGLIDALCCPHYDTMQNNGVSRSDSFATMMRLHSSESGIALDEWAALVIEGGETYRIVSRKNHTGSVGPNGEFVPNSTGMPGAWRVSVDATTGTIVQTIVPTRGKISDIIISSRWIVEDPILSVARAQNPDDGLPPYWADSERNHLQPYYYIISISILGMIGSVVSIVIRKRRLDFQYEQVHSQLPNDGTDVDERKINEV